MEQSSTIEYLPQKLLPLCLTKEDVLTDIVAREIMEPILLTQDYLKMLGESSGRVILVSGCSESSFLCKFITRFHFLLLNLLEQ